LHERLARSGKIPANSPPHLSLFGSLSISESTNPKHRGATLAARTPSYFSATLARSEDVRNLTRTRLKKSAKGMPGKRQCRIPGAAYRVSFNESPPRPSHLLGMSLANDNTRNLKHFEEKGIMRSQKLRTVEFCGFALVMVAAVIWFAACSKTPTTNQSTSTVAPKASKTLDNLQTAFNGESNARARYLAFAQKAEAEGYGKVASLFRAAARAEDIHANNHAEVIRKLGAPPAADVKTPEVKSTAENLEAAIKGESYERDTMYPEFLKQAREDGNRDAVRTFNLAKEAEAEHAKLYTEASGNLAAWKTNAQTFYVCPSCGYTTPTLNFDKCPVDFTPRDKFIAVS
jgi:rubrerythrin